MFLAKYMGFEVICYRKLKSRYNVEWLKTLQNQRKFDNASNLQPENTNPFFGYYNRRACLFLLIVFSYILYVD